MWVHLEEISLGLFWFLGTIPEDLRKTAKTLSFYIIGPKIRTHHNANFRKLQFPPSTT
jgi:hypothetical protein